MNNITKMAEMMVELIKTELDQKETITLTDIEKTTRAVMQEVGRQAVAAAVESMNPIYPEGTSRCDCGNEATYIRQRPTQLHTLFGKMEVKRGYYLCSICRCGHYPLDRELGLRPNALSAELTRLVAMTGVQLPYGKGSNLFTALTLVPVSDPAMAKATQQLGELVMEQESQQQEKVQEEAFLLQRQREARHPVRLYGAIDAAKVHIRDDEEHRWRDLKIGAWFEASGRPPTTPDGEWTIQAKNIRYYTDICPAHEFGQLVWSSGVRCDAQLAQELVILGDGADWIWNLVDKHFPQAVQILDWFHASEHLMPVAQAVFKTEETQVTWLSQMKQLMWEGHIDQLIAACNTLADRCSADVIRTTANYFATHKERMRYAFFRRQGYQIGSGTIESAAKQISMMRMKVPGAIWNEENARKVAKARAAYLSDQWNSLPLAI